MEGELTSATACCGEGFNHRLCASKLPLRCSKHKNIKFPCCQSNISCVKKASCCCFLLLKGIRGKKDRRLQIGLIVFGNVNLPQLCQFADYALKA